MFETLDIIPFIIFSSLNRVVSVGEYHQLKYKAEQSEDTNYHNKEKYLSLGKILSNAIWQLSIHLFLPHFCPCIRIEIRTD